MEYRELNKDTLKYHFPYLLLTRFWTHWLERSTFLSWMGSNDITRSALLQKTRKRQHLHVLGGHMPTRYYPLVFATH
jgi:hypothetical protein